MANKKKKKNKMSADEMLIREAKSKKGCEWDRISSYYEQYGITKMFRIWDTFGQTPHSKLGKQSNSYG
jgi:hypothetical protein